MPMTRMTLLPRRILHPPMKHNPHLLLRTTIILYHIRSTQLKDLSPSHLYQQTLSPLRLFLPLLNYESNDLPSTWQSLTPSSSATRVLSVSLLEDRKTDIAPSMQERVTINRTFDCLIPQPWASSEGEEASQSCTRYRRKSLMKVGESSPLVPFGLRRFISSFPSLTGSFFGMTGKMTSLPISS